MLKIAKLSISALLMTVALSSSISAQNAWTPAGDNIRTKWAEEVNPSSPLSEYPRPQMSRSSWQSLNGLWNYQIKSVEDNSAFSSQGQILVPFALESSLSGVGKTINDGECLVYQRTFSVPKNWKGKRVLLNFDAIDWKAEIYVNGSLVATHTGGYTPISVDVTPYLSKKAKQTLSVKVEDDADQSFQPRGKQVRKPSGIWYTSVTGIWQSVWMEAVPETRITDYNVKSDIDNGTIEVTIESLNLKKGQTVVAALTEGGVGYDPLNPSSNIVVMGSSICENDSESGTSVIKLNVPDAKLWSPETPYLYGLKLSIVQNVTTVDQVTGYTAMRKISVVKDSDGYKRMALNNKALFQFGPLDQGWWPDGLYTAPTDEALHYDVLKTKEMGFNMIRKHIKVEPSRWYMWCDVEGIMVWQDMPSIADYSLMDTRPEAVSKASANEWSADSFVGGTDAVIPSEWKDNYYKEWTDIMNALKKFQCIVVWVPFNEAWGQFDTPEVVSFTRANDSTRLINPASGGNYTFTGDIIDVHHYPEPRMNAFEAKFVNVLGEYGGIGLPLEGHLWQKDRNWGYIQYKNANEVFETYSKYAEMLQGFIRTGCAAAIYTQTTDVEGEVNGLMTYDRAVIKMDLDKLSHLNRFVIESMNK